jgi:hypothetical protein
VAPASLREFFVASAGVAGALIGLLFVAISVEHGRLTGEDADEVHRVRASAALTAFSNAFTISLFALVPGVSLGWTGLAVSVLGLGFVAGSVLLLRRARAAQPVAARDGLFLAGLVVAFLLQLMFAIRLGVRATDTGAADGIAILVIVCFLIGIARAWELIGGPSIGLGREVTAMVRAHAQPGPATPRHDDRADSAEDA